MDQSSLQSLTDLPQSMNNWYFAYRRLRTWVEDDDGELVRPWMMLSLDLNAKIILNIQMSSEPSAQEALDSLCGTMLHPMEGLDLEPERPHQIHFEDRKLATALTSELAQIDVKVKFRPHTEALNYIVRMLEEEMREGEAEIPGLLAQRKVTQKLASGLFSAAAEFYRQAPWVKLSNDDVLAVKVLPSKEVYYVTVLGQGGVEYGLSLYKDWEALEKMFSPYDDVFEIIPDEGAHSITYGEIYDLPFDDIDAIEKYGWEVADSLAYPLPIVFFPSGELKRPSREDLLWFEAALRAISVFVRDHLEIDQDGYLQPSEARLKVPTSSGEVAVEIKYPVEGLPEDWGLRPRIDEWDSDDFQDMPPMPDRRALEGDMARMFPEWDDEALDTKLKKAQDLMYQAWDESNPAKRITMAHQALEISPDCADAYVLLAEEEAGDPQRALEYYQMGLQAGERALGEEFFEENEGYFWGVLASRPYMRAKAGLAGLLWQMRRGEEALDHYEEMLRLNPGDNQGIRYLLVDVLLSMNRDTKLAKLLDQYEGDWSAVWTYTRALLTFRKEGTSKRADQALAQALEQNPYVPAFLTGQVRIPHQLPIFIGMGDEREAVHYARDHLNHWRRTQGAVEWLQNCLSKFEFEPPESEDK